MGTGFGKRPVASMPGAHRTPRTPTGTPRLMSQRRIPASLSSNPDNTGRAPSPGLCTDAQAWLPVTQPPNALSAKQPADQPQKSSTAAPIPAATSINPRQLHQHHEKKNKIVDAHQFVCRHAVFQTMRAAEFIANNYRRCTATGWTVGA